MALGALDIGLTVDATSAVAGFNKAAAQAAKFSGSMEKVGKSASTMSREYNRSLGAMRASTQNLSFQIQDIGVQLASGQSPFVIAAQQGSQMAQVFSAMKGSGGTLRALGGALMSMVSPVTLLTVGVIALGGAVFQWLGSLKQAVPEMDALLKEHDRILGEIKKSYPQITDLIVQLETKSKRLTFLEAQDNVDALAEKTRAANEDVLKLLSDFAGLDSGFAAGGMREQDEALDLFLTDMDAGIAAYQERVNELSEAHLELMKSVGFVTDAEGELVAGLDPLNQKLADATLLQLQQAEAALASAKALRDLGTTGYAPLDNLIRQQIVALIDGTANAITYNHALEAMGAAAPNAEIKQLVDNLIRENAAAYEAAIATQNAANAAGAGVAQFLALAAALGQATAAARAYNSAMSSLDAIAATTLTDTARAEAEFNKAMTSSMSGIERAAALEKRNAALARISEQQAAADKAHLDSLRDQVEPLRVMNRELEEANRLFEAQNVPLAEQQRILENIRKNYETPDTGTGGGGGGGGGGGAAAAGATAATDANRQWLDSIIDLHNPMDQVNADIARLNEMQKAGTVTLEEYSAAMDVFKKRAAQAGETATETFNAAAKFGTIMDDWGQQVASSLADAIVEGENLEDVFKDLLKQLLKMIIQMMILEPLMKSVMSGFGAGGGTGGGDFMSSMMGAIMGGVAPMNAAASDLNASASNLNIASRNLADVDTGEAEPDEGIAQTLRGFDPMRGVDEFMATLTSSIASLDHTAADLDLGPRTLDPRRGSGVTGESDGWLEMLTGSIEGLNRTLRSGLRLRPEQRGRTDGGRDSRGTVVNSAPMNSFNGLTINVPVNVDAIGGDKASALAKRIRQVVSTEIVREQRPGGLLWGG